MAWTINGSAVASGNEPLADSQWPERPRARYVEHNAVGATVTYSTRIGTYSLGADGSAPMVLHFWCTAAFKDTLVALDKLNFAIIDTWARTVNVHCKDVHVERISQAPPAWSQHPAGGAGERFHVWLYLLGT